MKTISIQKLFRSLLAATVLFGAAACTDDHFDISDGGSATASQTIWQNIQAQPQLSDLAAILQRVPVIKSVSDKNSRVLYSTLLDQPQTFTFWAPVNGSYDAQSYLDRLDQAETIADDSLRAVAKYRIGYQFVMNHLARFNYESSAEEQEVFLMNSKRAYYNAGAGEFNGIPLLAGYESIPSSNGTLHILDGCSPFRKNLRENLYEDYRSSESPLYWKDVRSLSDVIYVTASDGTTYIYQDNYIDTNRSVEGGMDNEGNMVYMDTVWASNNDMADYAGGSLANEDSTFVGIVPATETAFNNAITKLLPLFNYNASYFYDWDDENLNFKSSMSIAAEEADSLAYDRAWRRLMQSMYFSASNCGFNTEQGVDSAALIDYVLHADTINTSGRLVYRNPNVGGENPVFEGKEPTRFSNGYVFQLDEMDFDPAWIWAPKIEFSPYGAANLLRSQNCTPSSVLLVESERNPAVSGYLQDNQYERFEVTSGIMTVDIRLPQVLSTSYRLDFCMAPNYTRLSDAGNNMVEVLDPETGEPTGELVPGNVYCQFGAQVFYDAKDPARNPTKVTPNQATITVRQDTIQWYTIFDKVTFSKCYYSLPTPTGESYPFVRITLTVPQQRGLPNNPYNNNALNIARIRLVPLPADEQ